MVGGGEEIVYSISFSRWEEPLEKSEKILQPHPRDVLQETNMLNIMVMKAFTTDSLTAAKGDGLFNISCHSPFLLLKGGISCRCSWMMTFYNASPASHNCFIFLIFLRFENSCR